MALLLFPWVAWSIVIGSLVACEIDRSCRRRGCGRPEGRPYDTTGSGPVGAMLASPATPLRSPPRSGLMADLSDSNVATISNRRSPLSWGMWSDDSWLFRDGRDRD